MKTKKNSCFMHKYFKKERLFNHMEFTAIIKKGEKQYVALCPELDVVSQGYSVESSLKNLQEACELYVEEMGFPEGVSSDNLIIASFEVKDETTKTLRAKSH